MRTVFIESVLGFQKANDFADVVSAADLMRSSFIKEIANNTQEASNPKQLATFLALIPLQNPRLWKSLSRGRGRLPSIGNEVTIRINFDEIIRILLPTTLPAINDAGNLPVLEYGMKPTNSLHHLFSNTSFRQPALRHTLLGSRASAMMLRYLGETLEYKTTS